MLEQTGLYKNRGKANEQGIRERVKLDGDIASMPIERLKDVIRSAIARERA